MEKLLQSVWFGETGELLINEPNEEEKKMIIYIEMFKSGDFGSKREFVKFFTNSTNYATYAVGMRVFLAVCKHKDLELICDFVKVCDEQKLRVFLAFVQEALSYQVIPFLIELLDIWEETDVEKTIIRTICEMLRFDCTGDEYDVIRIRKEYDDFSKKNDINKYYYKGELFHIGILTRKILRISMDCKVKNKKYYAMELSTLLSNCTGRRCPVENGMHVDATSMSEITKYICRMVDLDHEKGKKYFYNHLIE